uniref:SnoaL-like domain-containing protein n=1 Tax=Aureoumbra lagunensis TaxID=44058 RepID=A0A7S3NJ44_9STRA|mmetsp:Transcript_2129/g.3298  ORF Transcript_2129/g.3298 Transcript_2129/m.3298 type:complete len:286 (+) Transcript_2129:76-933(+)
MIYVLEILFVIFTTTPFIRSGLSFSTLATSSSASLLLTKQKNDRIQQLEKKKEMIDTELNILKSSSSVMYANQNSTTDNEKSRTPSLVMLELYDAFNARDAYAIGELMNENAIYEDLLLGDTTVCRGKNKFIQVLNWHPAFILTKLGFPADNLKVIVDHIACDGYQSCGIEWHVEFNGKQLPLGRGLSHAILDQNNKLIRVVDICEAPWRVIGLLLRPALSFTFTSASTALFTIILINLFQQGNGFFFPFIGGEARGPFLFSTSDTGLLLLLANHYASSSFPPPF